MDCDVCDRFKNWRPTKKSKHGPLSGEQLGRATWSFLHTTAAYYPISANAHQKRNMIALLESLPVLYPCQECGIDFGETMKEHPPNVTGREELSKWLCERHNEV